MKNKSNSFVFVVILVVVLICCCMCLACGIATSLLSADTNSSTDTPDVETVDSNDIEGSDEIDGEPNPEDEDLDIRVAPGEVVTFEGTFEDYDPSCAFDAECKAMVDGTWIVTNPGFVVAGSVKVGRFELDPDNDLGKKVKVRAEVTEDGMTLVGSESYYIELAD